MAIYAYDCEHCKAGFEIRAEMPGFDYYPCPKCTAPAPRIPSPVTWSFGWRLADECHERFGPRDEYVKDV
uniref:Uncharacterized protein n=1 Tax=viral metagenome TaxID=1070528 RepID=A0A6M3JVT6_9ZZZZ